MTWRKASGRPVLSYDDAASEALAFGWIDTKGGSVGDERTRLAATRATRIGETAMRAELGEQSR